VSLEEQLRNDAQSLREVGWFNRAIMMDAAANEIQKLNERIKRLEEALNGTVNWIVKMADCGDAGYWDSEEVSEIIAARAALKSKEEIK